MYLYINESLNIYPRFPGDIQLIDPNWTVDEPLPEGWELVKDTPLPQYEIGQVIEELYPEKIDGIWYQKWTVRNMTEEELEEQRLFKEQLSKQVNESQQQA